MCGNLFRSPKVATPVVQQVAPAPQNVTGADRQVLSDETKKKNQQRRAAMNADSLRSTPTMLADAQGKQTLG